MADLEHDLLLPLVRLGEVAALEGEEGAVLDQVDLLLLLVRAANRGFVSDTAVVVGDATTVREPEIAI